MQTLYDVFISYNRGDSIKFAKQLRDGLIEISFNAWLDLHQINPGENFQKRINGAIEKSHNFIFIMSPGSITSPYCQKEIDLAVELNKRIIPIAHINTRDSEKCQGKIHDRLISLHNAFFSKSKLESGKIDFNQKLAELANVLHQNADYVEQHTQILVKALYWHRNHRDTHDLLISKKRQQAEVWLEKRFDEQPPCKPTDLQCEFICESTINANNLMTQAFISAMPQDKAFVAQLTKTLLWHHITVWRSKHDILMVLNEYREGINAHIEEADNFIYVISPASVQSDECLAQLQYAVSLNKRIIPLLIDDTDLTHLSPTVQSLPLIDFSRYENTEPYDNSVDKLIQELHEDAVYYEQHKRLLVKARQWKQHNYDDGVLLRGYNLEKIETWLERVQKRQIHQPSQDTKHFIAASQRQRALPVPVLDVFISYSQADSDFSRTLNDHLQAKGKTTWFDQESIAPTENFQEEIHRGIEASDNFLFIISPDSINSDYCADEVEYAKEWNKRIITVLHRPVKIEELHPFLKRVEWIDFNRYQGSFSINFDELINVLEIDREHVRGYTKWMLRAREWSKQGENAELLLGKSELAAANKWLQEAENKKLSPTQLQKRFIAASQQAIKMAKIAEERKLEQLVQGRTAELEAHFSAERLKNSRLQRLLLAVGSLTLIIAIGSSWYVWENTVESGQCENTVEPEQIALPEATKEPVRETKTRVKEKTVASPIKSDEHFIWNKRGNALRKLGRYEEALESYDKALQFKPAYHPAWNGRGNALDNSGHYEEALESYDKALQFKPDYHIAWNGRGNALDNSGHYEEALESYDKALQFKPDVHYAWENRGTLLHKLGRYEEAIESYDKALQFKPDGGK